MKSNNENNNNLNKREEEENQKKKEDDLARLDSPNNADNETNKILEKEENNNVIELDNPNKAVKEIKVKPFFHDKDITEDSIIYFSNKLKQSNKIYKIFLYISILLFILDIIIWYISKDILHNYFNLLSILIILITILYQAYIFRHNFETISKELYGYTQKIIKCYFFVGGLYIGNIIFITYSYIFNNNEIILDNNYIMNIPLVVFIYILINAIIPIILFIKLFSIKKRIKDLSSAKGEIYESAKIEEIQIINSIINEI